VPSFTVSVTAHARKNRLVQISPGHYQAHLTAPAQKGQANSQLVRLIADFFQVRPNQVLVTFGHRSKTKTITLI